MSNLIKICPVEAELTDEQEEGRAGRQDEASSSFSTKKTAINSSVCCVICSDTYLSIYFQSHERDEKNRP